jgi:1,4-alpha-glucan branching enzyme
MADEIQKKTTTTKAKQPGASLAGKRRARFQIEAVQGANVFLAGSFNDWNPRKNKLTYKDGVYSTALTLPKGRHEYKFIIDDIWCIDPNCAEWAPNGLGSLNSVVVVG